MQKNKKLKFDFEKYNRIYPGTPRTKKSSVHYGDDYRYEESIKQSKKEKVSIEEIKNYILEVLYELGIELKEILTVKNPDENNINYKNIKEKYNLKDEKDIVWLKFTKCGYLGCVAKGNDINFDIPKSKQDYNLKNKNDKWVHTTSGILIHKLKKEWDKSFVLIVPLKNIPVKYKSGDIERIIGNYLIDNNVPILDFYSHNY